jgi:hypothetical protein
MSYSELKEKVFAVALDSLKKGPGYAQESVVLREALEQLRLRELADQQRLLTCWHDLFRDGQLSWGYDVDNPSPPFFHAPTR